MRCALLVALVALGSPALAESVATPPPGAVAAGANGALIISSRTCTELRGDTAPPSADYRPGVDANGQAVAPADLPSSATSAAVDDFPIEISSDLAGRIHLPGSVGSKAILGYVTLRGNQPYFNGTPLSGDQRDALETACRSAAH